VLVLGLLALGVLAVPLAAHGASKEGAVVPTELLAQAQAHPDQTFLVIVQGRGRERSSDVETDVDEERNASPGRGKGVRKRFATISGVAAELTGRQISRLAERNDILSITRDAPVTASGGMLPPSPLAVPMVDGIAQVGESLTASDGVWSGSEPITYVRRWQRCDALGSVCVDIEGAAGAVYTVAAADVGSTLRFAIKGTNDVGAETGVSDPTAVVAEAPVGPLPPVNLALPAIAGTPTEGQTLSASEGTWGGSFPVAYAHAWQRCDATGAGCVGAAGATGASYVLTSADVGSTLRAVVTATDAGGSTSTTSLPTAVVAAAPRPPAASAPPAVSGEARDGATLTAAPGAWTASGTFSQSYAWERCGAAYDQAVLADLPAGYWRLDNGTATDASGHGLNGVVAGTVGQVGGATASSTALELGAAAGVNVPNATVGPAFTLEAWVRLDRAQQDKPLLGRWSYADGGGALLWIDTEGHYGLAAGRNPANYLAATVAPVLGRWEHVVGTLDGTLLRVFVNGVEVGSKPFTATMGTPLVDFEIGKYGEPKHHLEGALDEAALYDRALAPADVRRHYDAACHVVTGATGQSYSVGAADVGSRLRVRVTASNEAGSGTAVSDATAPVAGAPPVSLSAPQVSGAAIELQTLTAAPGTWSGMAPIEFSYRWQRCDGAGGACVDILGALGTNYALSAADVGATLKVVVSATNASGSSAVASAPTAQVVSAAPVATAPPSVSGVAQDGGTLTASPGTWTGTQPIAHSYRWQRCDAAGLCADIAGATGATHVLAAADVGATVKVFVSATNASGSSEAASAVTAPVGGVVPVSVSAPQVGGAALETQTLTGTSGLWSGTQPIEHAYRWQRCDGSGVCTDIPGATSATYALTAADVGARVKVVVSATNVSGSTERSSETTALVVAAAPVSLSAPEVSGAAIEQQTLTASPGTWSGIAPIAFSYRWQRCDAAGGTCVEIVGALGATYVLSAADVGASLKVVVSATNASGSSEAASSATGPIGGAPPVSATAPAVTGEPTETQTLTASAGTWNGSQPIEYRYRWQRCDTAGTCVDITDATADTYTLNAADVGARLKVVVSARNVAGSSVAASGTTAQVVAAAPVSVSRPQLGGAAIQRQTLTATPGTWSGAQPITHSYRWQRCAADVCADIPGVTAATYELTAADVGATVKVVVSATNPSGSSEAASEPTTQVLAGPPVDQVPPSVSGPAEDGGTLIAATGTWDGLDTTLAVRWERCNSAGAACTAVAGAEGTSYVLSEPDVGDTVRAVVTATNAAGSASAASAPSAVVVDSFTALQQWPSVVDAPAAWASAKANVEVPTIAIVDSGIEAGRSDFGGRVIHEETLTTLDPNSPGDGRGHGTFVASIAAGEGAGYAGVEPGAKLVSIDVLNDEGRATTSDVISAADWIYRNKATYGIRVANFSLTGNTPTSFRTDPLNRALEKLWFSGVVVVAAAGNYAVDGAASGVLFPPGNDPFILTVGATDTAGTVAPDDDFTAPWSAWGHTPDGFAKPDISAPGRYIVGAVPMTSTLAAERPGNLVAPGYMQLSGTSLAAPMASGAAAYVLSLHPDWTPDQVKGALMYHAVRLPSATANSYGIGELNVATAASVASPPNPNRQLNGYLIPDPAGGPEPVFDGASWSSTVEANEFWGVEFWGVEFWGVEFWGVQYWEPPAAPPPPASPADGTATSALNNASSDWLPAGGYWLTPRG
jgi:hypothetical protein